MIEDKDDIAKILAEILGGLGIEQEAGKKSHTTPNAITAGIVAVLLAGRARK